MKRKKFLPFLTVFLAITILIFTSPSPIIAQETDEEIQESKTTQKLSIDLNAGLNFVFNQTDIKLGDDDIENTLSFNYLVLEVNAALLDYLTLGVVVGLNQNYLKESVDFYHLPLSLREDAERFNSMVFGVRARSEFFSWNDVTFKAVFEFLHFKQYQNDFDINLPLVSGSAVLKNSFSQTALELLIQYEGLSSFVFFAGPQLNLIKGEITAEENIETLTGKETLEYKQKSAFGLVGGIRLDIGSSFEASAKLYLISRTSLSIEMVYTF